MRVWISTDPTATLKLNYTEKVNKMRNILSCWEYRRLTLIGKIQVIKRLALSQLTYILTLLATNQKFINEFSVIGTINFPVVLNFCRLLFPETVFLSSYNSGLSSLFKTRLIGSLSKDDVDYIENVI